MDSQRPNVRFDGAQGPRIIGPAGGESVDLDSIPHLCAAHGLTFPSQA